MVLRRIMASYIDKSDSIGDGDASSDGHRDLYHRLCVDVDVWMQDEIKGVDSKCLNCVNHFA